MTHAHLKNAFKELETVERHLEELTQLAIELGANQNGLNTYNTVKHLQAVGKELLDARKTAEANGYATLAFALKALGQKTPDIQLPEWALYAPAHWSNEASIETIYYWKNGRKIDAPKRKQAVTPLQAQRQLDRLKPTIKLVLDELYWDPEEMEEVKEALMTLGYTDFQQRLFGFLRQLTEAGEVEDAEEVSNEPDPELEASLEEMRQALGDEFDEDAVRCLLAIG